MRLPKVLGWVGFGALLFTAAAAAQQPSPAPAPRFEVVAIRPIPPNTPPTLREPGFTSVLPGGHFMDSRTTLFSMIILAYDIKNPVVELVGLPNWARDHSFSVEAKPSADFGTLPPAENRDQVRIMLRAMLVDRFHLQLQPRRVRLRRSRSISQRVASKSKRRSRRRLGRRWLRSVQRWATAAAALPAKR